MDQIFLLKLVSSFIVGGVFVSACTIAAERLGSSIGGTIGGLPSTVVVTLFFIGLVDTPEAASEATGIVPLIVGFNGLFLVTYAAIARHGFWKGLGAALVVWIVLSTMAVTLGLDDFTLCMALYIVLLALSHFLFARVLTVPVYGQRSVSFTPRQIALRAVLGGAIVGIGVYLSKVGGPTLGGVMASCPAVFISALVIAYASRGVEFSLSLTRPLMISALINVVVYALAARYLFLAVGLVLGTVLAFAISLGSAYGTYLLIMFSQRKAAAGTGPGR